MWEGQGGWEEYALLDPFFQARGVDGERWDHGMTAFHFYVGSDLGK